MVRIIEALTLKRLVLLSFIFKIALFFIIQPWSGKGVKMMMSDDNCLSYQQFAVNIATNHSFAPPQNTVMESAPPQYRWQYLAFRYDSFRVPGYALFLALVYFISGINPFVAILIQILLSLLSVTLVYKIVQELTQNKTVATLSTLLFCLDVHSVFLANLIYSDTLYVLLFLAGIYYFLRGYKKQNMPLIIASAFFMGMACLTRAVALAYPIILIVILCFANRKIMGWGIKASAVFMAVFLLVASSWVIRNHIAYGRWQFSTWGGYNMLMYFAAITESKSTGEAPNDVKNKFQDRADSLGFMKMDNVFDQSNLYEKMGLDYIKNHKAAYLKTHVEGMVHTMLSLGNPDLARLMGIHNHVGNEVYSYDADKIKANFTNKKEAAIGVITALIMLIQYIGMFIGFWFLWKNKNFLLLFFSLATVIYYTVITGPIGMYRYKLPIVFIICIVSGYGWYMVMRKRLEVLAPKDSGQKLNGL